MLSQEDKEAIIAELQTLKPGATIEVLVNSEKKSVKFAVVRPIDGRFQCRNKGQIAWYGPEQYVGILEAEQKPVEKPSLVDETIEANKNGTSWRDKVGVAYDVEASKIEYPSTTEVLTRERDGTPKVLMTTVTYEELPNPASDALAEFKIGEFGSLVVIEIGAMEALQATTGERVEGPVSVAALAERMGESPKKVAAAFTALNKGGYISQSGEKGARLIQLTALGWQYIATKELSVYQVKAGFVTVEPEAKEELKEVKPVMGDTLLSSMGRVSRKGGLHVSDMFTANNLRTVAEHYPELITLSPSSVEDAYFHAELTAGGYAILQRLAPEWMQYTPESKPVVECQPPADMPAEEAAKPRRGRKPGSGSDSPKLRKNMGGEGHVKGKGGRPPQGTKSLRERALEATREVLAQEDKISYKSLAPIIAEKLGIKVHPAQNVLLKLWNANFFVLNASGQIANPVQLTDKGKAGYSTMHGQNIRGQVKELIAEELTDAQIARRLGCDLAYIHDVRTNRGVKMVEEAVTE